MTDNTILPVPTTSGDVIATDDIGGVKFQRVKLIHGADGVNDGDVSTVNPLPVEIQGSLGTADTKALGSALVAGDVGLVTNTVIHGVTTAGGGAYVDVKVNPSGAMAVEVGASALPTGAATQATLAAIDGYFKAEDTAATSGDKGLVMLAQRFSADTTTTDADGDYTILKLDEEGRLKVSSKPASYADITGDITAVQATIGTPVAGGTVAGDVSRASNIMIFCAGTFSTVNCTFEGSLEASGDTNWFGVQAVRSNANTIETTTGNLSAQPAYAWEASVNSLKRFRVRCTARTSGTQSWRFVQGTYATEPIPAAQVSGTQPVSGTVTATVTNATAFIFPSAPAQITDVASAALTTTTTTAAITPTWGTNFVVSIPVTAVSGTTPTLDIGIDESDDTGTNWYRIYDFPRITATGIYRSPQLTLRGNRLRYVQTVTGTTPSFTRSVLRQQRADSVPLRSQFLDRTIVPNTLNSVTPTYYIEGCKDFNMTVRCTAQTTPATMTMRFSNDGTNWFNNATTLTTAVGVAQAKFTNEMWKFAQGIVTTAGSGITLGEAVIVGVGN